MNLCECLRECTCLTFQIDECDFCEGRKCKFCVENENEDSVIIDD